MERTIWYDVSGLYGWTGNFTGIQRVVYNLGKCLAANSGETPARFFIFNGISFVEISFEQLEERLRELNDRSRPKSQTQRSISPRELHHYSMVLAKRTVAGSRLEAPLRFVYGGLRFTRRGLRTRKLNTTQDIFGPDDVVVVADGNWQFKYFAYSLIKAKKEVGFKMVHLVYDLVAVKNPALASQGAEAIIGGYFEKIFAQADLLLAISQSTKNDAEWFIAERGITQKPPVSVIKLGSDIRRDSIPQKQPAALLPKAFILAVGTIEVRKNYMLLYYAYKYALSQGLSMPHLVIVGRKGWMADETYSLMTNDTDLKKHITIMNGVTDMELEWLYRHCLFTVYPSFYEGWGLPVAESLLRGKCCISSNTSSMPEVGGDLVRYTSPYDTAAMAMAITDLCSTTRRKKMEARIKAEYEPPSWQDTCSLLVKTLSTL